MSMLPARSGDDPPSGRDLARATRDRNRTELAIYRHGLGARYRAEADRLDAQAVSDAVQASLEEELNLLDYGLRRAAGSAAAGELVARKANLLSSLNDRRIGRRFGG
jgi:hypothetical protein